MSLSSDLVAQFVKITNDKKTTKSETTVYGTVVSYNGADYVKLDGSDLLTPVTTTTDAVDGDRVTVLLKNHSAIVTGNVSSPSARTDDVKDAILTSEEASKKISEFEIVIADKVDTEQLNAESARIDDLVADNVVIKQTLAASGADFESVKAQNAEIQQKLTAHDASINNLSLRRGDSITVTFRGAGYVTNAKKDVSFWLPLTTPVIGSPTISASSGNGFIFRQGDKYTHGSSASVYAIPTSYEVSNSYRCGLYIKAVFEDVTNVTNNDVIGIYWNGTITFS